MLSVQHSSADHGVAHPPRCPEGWSRRRCRASWHVRTTQVSISCHLVARRGRGSVGPQESWSFVRTHADTFKADIAQRRCSFMIPKKRHHSFVCLNKTTFTGSCNKKCSCWWHVLSYLRGLTLSLLNQFLYWCYFHLKSSLKEMLKRPEMFILRALLRFTMYQQ